MKGGTGVSLPPSPPTEPRTIRVTQLTPLTGSAPWKRPCCIRCLWKGILKTYLHSISLDAHITEVVLHKFTVKRLETFSRG